MHRECLLSRTVIDRPWHFVPWTTRGFGNKVEGSFKALSVSTVSHPGNKNISDEVD